MKNVFYLLVIFFMFTTMGGIILSQQREIDGLQEDVEFYDHEYKQDKVLISACYREKEEDDSAVESYDWDALLNATAEN